MSFELFLILSYISAGPLTWFFYGQLIHAGRRKMLLMYRPAHPIKASPPPLVTLMIPAKDEGERIRACIESALGQDYPSLRVVAIDDRSTDRTGQIMDEMAGADPRLTVLHIKEPPALGWTGKNNALYTAAKDAPGEWLLFVDSDVVLERDALTVAMSVVLRKEFDLLSLLPKLESHSLWESLLVPLAGAAASSLYLIALTNNARYPGSAFANGQFLLISRKTYDAIGGHATVRDRFCEDVEIARLVKSHGFRPRVSWGIDFASVRMYSSLESILRGWSRIFYAARVGNPGTILSGIGFLVMNCFTGYAALAWAIYRLLIHPSPAYHGLLGISWLVLALTHLALMMHYIGQMYEWCGNPRRNAWLFPLGGSMLMLIFLRALRMCITKKVEWRGTSYSHTMAQRLKAAAPVGQADAG